jgi:hypothetical protein
MEPKSPEFRIFASRDSHTSFFSSVKFPPLRVSENSRENPNFQSFSRFADQEDGASKVWFDLHLKTRYFRSLLSNLNLILLPHGNT